MSKIGVALAGGGPVGGIYEVGACAALQESIQGLHMTQADCYVGVSAGGFLAASLANGIDPLLLTRMLINKDVKGVFDPKLLLRPAFKEYFERLCSIPKLTAQSTMDYLRHPFTYGVFGSFQRLSSAIPTGLFNNAPIDALLRHLFSEEGRTNDFRQLKRRLFLVATELDSGESVAFGSPGHDHVPISTAVQASAALPGLFPPVKIEGRHYVDGALIKTLHASVALREGVELLLCVNPLVPFDASLVKQRADDHPEHLVEGGLPVVLSQTFRSIIHSRMRVGMDRYKHEFKDADVLLFEPAQNDADMFYTNVFSYRDRRRLCEHAYQHTRQDLYRRRDELSPILARHGLTLDLSVLRDDKLSLVNRNWRREAKKIPSVRALDDALANLDQWLTEQHRRQAVA